MDKETLGKINALTRRDFKPEELYTFPVTLCGNEIDRDGERFSDEALEKMMELFVGKPIVKDHNPSADNQVARIYDTELVTDTGETTSYGEPYKYLKGYAYMVRTDSNADLIKEIDAGIKNKVSVGCSAAIKRCSICGTNTFDKQCEHIKGREYDGQLCYHILDGINDAYELSFVAVPAQTDAGVTKKSFETGGMNMEKFTPITTKADFDAAAQPLIDAAVAEAVKQYEGWISPEDHQKALDTLTSENTAKLLGAYRTKAALMAGLPAELADRLTGDTEEALQKDAEKLASFTKIAKHETPSFSVDGGGMSGVEKAFYERNKNLDPRNRKENA